MVVEQHLHKRLLHICYKHHLHHLGSYFSSIDIINNIFANKLSDDIFILSNGHAAVALYVVLEKYYDVDAEDLLKEHGEHPKRDDRFIHCSTGSLGQGITVAVGRAIAKPNRDVHCLISDGECHEGSVWEALRFAWENNLANLKIYVNANGWSAYDPVNVDYLEKRINAFHPDVKFIRTRVDHCGLPDSVAAHYMNFTEEHYEKEI
tara:strand:- start:1778 stop:2395 length:618 start_codon:yes stop_codon:yes gene_type:complete